MIVPLDAIICLGFPAHPKRSKKKNAKNSKNHIIPDMRYMPVNVHMTFGMQYLVDLSPTLRQTMHTTVVLAKLIFPSNEETMDLGILTYEPT